MSRSFLENEYTERIMSSVATGQAANESSVVDTVGFDSFTFIAALGAIDPTGTVVMKLQQCDTDDGSFADLTDASATATANDDEGLLVVEIYRPAERYLKAIVTTDVANGEIDSVICIKRDPKEIPVTQSDDVIDSAFVASPDESA